MSEVLFHTSYSEGKYPRSYGPGSENSLCVRGITASGSGTRVASLSKIGPARRTLPRGDETLEFIEQVASTA